MSLLAKSASSVASGVASAVAVGESSSGGVAGEPLPSSFWMEPASGDEETLAEGEFGDASITGTPAFISAAKTYHAGSINAVAFDGTERIHYPSVDLDDITDGFWVGGLIRMGTSFSHDTLISTGASSNGEAGWQLRAMSSNFYWQVSDGITAVGDTTNGDPFPLNEWFYFLFQLRWTSTTDVETRLRLNGWFSSDRAKSGVTDMTGVTSAFGGVVLGAGNTSGSLPFLGDACIQTGTLTSNEFLSLEQEYFLCNYNRSRLHSDAQTYTAKNKISLLRSGPHPGGLIVTAYTDSALTMKVYDEATRTLQHTTSELSPTNGVIKFEVTSGLTADTEYICEFTDSAGNVQARECHVLTWPDANNDVEIQAIGCSEWAEYENGALRSSMYASAKIGGFGSQTRPHLCVFPEDEGYRDPGVQSPAVSTSDVTEFVERDVECHYSFETWWYLDHVPLLFGLGNHDVEDGGGNYDKDSAYCDIAVEFARLVMPIQDSEWGHATAGWYYSKSLNDFRLISMDIISTKTVATEMIDSTQKDWWKEEVATAALNDQIILNNWAFVVKYGSTPLTDKHWNYYSTQITELFDFLEDIFGSAEQHLLSFQGDVHIYGMDDGTNQGNLDTGGDMSIPCIHASRYAHGFANSVATMDLNIYESSSVGHIGSLAFVDATTTTALTADVYIDGVKQNGTSLTDTFTKAATVPAPTITGQPSSVAATPGQDVSFTVTATSPLTPTYQWEVDTGGGYSDVVGETSATISLSNIALGDDGDLYRCKVTNVGGTTTSSAATLTVAPFTDPTDFVNLAHYNADGGLAYNTALVDINGQDMPVLRDLDSDYTYPAIVKTPCLDLVSANSDYVDLGAGYRSTVSEANDFSVAIEFARDNLTFATLMSISSSTSDRFGIEIGSGDVRATVYNGSHAAKSMSATIDNSDFHRIVVTYDTDTHALRLWLDGTEAVGTSAPSTTALAVSLLGSYPSNFYMDGKIYSLRTWNSTLGATEAADISNGIAHTTAPTLWHGFQEGSGNTIYNIIANSNHATNNGGDWGSTSNGDIRDLSILYGGKMSSGVFICGLTSGASCANGDALVLSAGKFGNTGSTINFNPLSNATLTALGYETAYEVGDARESAGTSNTKFRRTAASGDDRFFGTTSALENQALTDAQTYAT